MKLQNQVCTRKQALKLKELGFYQGSALYHTRVHYYEHGGFYDGSYYVSHKRNDDGVSAFNVAELGAMLPDDCKSYQDNEFWSADDSFGLPFKGETEAEARAELLIHLIVANQTSVETCNERLKGS